MARTHFGNRWFIRISVDVGEFGASLKWVFLDFTCFRVHILIEWYDYDNTNEIVSITDRLNFTLLFFPVHDIYHSEEYYGESVLHMALANEDMELLRLIIDKGEEVMDVRYEISDCITIEHSSASLLTAKIFLPTKFSN